MANWKKTCPSFAQVRKMIDDYTSAVTQCKEIMRAIAACCNEISSNEYEWEFYDDFQYLKLEIYDDMEMMDEDDYDSAEATVNDYLADFYDLCDSAEVWLEV